MVKTDSYILFNFSFTAPAEVDAVTKREYPQYSARNDIQSAVKYDINVATWIMR
jgi:hypothetical protein